MKFEALVTIPRRYINVHNDLEKWDAEIDCLGFLEVVEYSREEASEFYYYDRNSMNVTVGFEFDSSDPEEAGDYLEDKIPGSWHIDEVLEAE